MGVLNNKIEINRLKKDTNNITPIDANITYDDVVKKSAIDSVRTGELLINNNIAIINLIFHVNNNIYTDAGAPELLFDLSKYIDADIIGKIDMSPNNNYYFEVRRDFDTNKVGLYVGGDVNPVLTPNNYGVKLLIIIK